MTGILTLLTPRWRAVHHAWRAPAAKSHWGRYLLLAVIGSLFWFGALSLALRVLRYFAGIEGIGHILTHKLLAMVLITAFALLLFSAILTMLSKLYLSRDLVLVHALPVPAHEVFTARWIEGSFDSAWMVIVYTLPVFLAYGQVYQAAPGYYLLLVTSLLALALTATAASALLVLIAVVAIPANRMRNLFIFLGILLFVVLYLAVRLLKPEQLVDPETFTTVMTYLAALQTPASPLLPTTWAFDTLRCGLSGAWQEACFHAALALSAAGVLILVMVQASDWLYARGFSKAQAASPRLFRFRTTAWGPLRALPGPMRAFVVKELKTFVRDQTQWSQLFLIAALVVIYIYNFKALPLERSPIQTVYLQNLLAFLNVGLALFVLAAITGRFAFPAVSGEREAFWLVQTAPLSLRAFLWIKFSVYVIPLLVLSEILVVVTNLLLQVSAFMMTLSTLTVALMVPGVVALGIGLGAAYPDFKAENPVQTVTGFGGLLYMLLAALFIGAVIVLQAGPVHALVVAELRGRSLSTLRQAWNVGAFAICLGLCLAALILPMRHGERALERRRH
jgi:ABC-2 type transport system permease protein